MLYTEKASKSKPFYPWAYITTPAVKLNSCRLWQQKRALRLLCIACSRYFIYFTSFLFHNDVSRMLSVATHLLWARNLRQTLNYLPKVTHLEVVEGLLCLQNLCCTIFFCFLRKVKLWGSLENTSWGKKFERGSIKLKKKSWSSCPFQCSSAKAWSPSSKY